MISKNKTLTKNQLNNQNKQNKWIKMSQLKTKKIRRYCFMHKTTSDLLIIMDKI